MFNLTFLSVTMNELKTFAMIVFAGLATFLHPIAGNIFAIIILLAVHCFVGLIRSLLVENGDFEWKKMWASVKEFFIMFGIAVFIYILGWFQKNPQGAEWCVCISVYAMIYFYGMRILRNLRSLTTKNSAAYFVLDFLYTVLSLEILKSIPGIQMYMAKHREEFDNEIVIPDEDTTEN